MRKCTKTLERENEVEVKEEWEFMTEDEMRSDDWTEYLISERFKQCSCARTTET